MSKTFKTFFSRDFTFLHLEVWYRAEAINKKPWLRERQPFWPYLAFHRAENTVRAFYDVDGVRWIQDKLAAKVQNDPQFLFEVADHVRKTIQPIRLIYEREQALPLAELKQFLSTFEQGFPWFEAMWWLCEMPKAQRSAINNQQSTDGWKIIAEVRNETKLLSVGVDNVIRDSLRRLFPAVSQFVHVLGEEEVYNRSVPSQKELQERGQEFWYTAGTLHTGMTQAEFETRYKLSIQKLIVPEGTNMVKGKTAYPGNVTGRVRKVLGHVQIPVLQEGEILVSTMTMPDFLPAMKKAAAFVTDEGGLTSHAAIIARELKKPCVVGTKFATQVFRDGDMVDVDAEKGIVRLLKKQQKR